MRTNGRYYLGRLIKIGIHGIEDILNAIKAPDVYEFRDYSWTITNSQIYDDFIFAHLTKFRPNSTIQILDSDSKKILTQPEPNQIIASSPFIFIPFFSGIAALHLSKDIPYSSFDKYFCKVLEKSLGNFFVKLHVDSISDLRTFIEKIQKLDHIQEISADIHPPNPLFGDLWEPLVEYLKSRKAKELSLKEKASSKEGLDTQIIEHMEQIDKQTEKHIYIPNRPPAITDSAILMAADGYGEGKIKGISSNKKVIIKTSDTRKFIEYKRDALPEELYKLVSKKFEQISHKRNLKHGQ